MFWGDFVLENKRVVIGLSGGVDSAVAAYLLKQQGYGVIGVMLNLSQNDEQYLLHEGGCCSLSSVLDARKVAEMLDIPFYVLNYKDAFKEKIVDYFVYDYMKGNTPNPCVECNRHIKFGKFLKSAKTLGADYIATGHYANIEEVNGKYLLKKGVDEKKDQTYMLYTLTQAQLKNVLMPCGKYLKEEVREIAKQIGMDIHNKKDSEEICFVPDGNHGNFISNIEKVREGNFVDKEGKILGKHKGIVYYTIGQRKGLNLALGKPAYVIEIRAKSNEVVIGDESDIFFKNAVINDVNVISGEGLEDGTVVQAKIRYQAKVSNAKVFNLSDGCLKIVFKNPQRAMTKGQSLVIYDGDILVGGGIIRDYF